MLIAARELDLDGVPNRSWQGRHLINTRGCGVLMAPAGRVASERLPRLSERRARPPRAVLQPQPHRLRRRRHRGERAPVRGRQHGRTRAPRGWRCRRSCAAWRSAWRSWTTTSSPPGRSTPTRRCCGCATSATGWRSWRRSCPSTATRTRSSIDGTVQWVVDAYTSTSRYPYAEAVGDDVALEPATAGSPATPTTSATASRPSSTPTTAR